MECTGKSMHTCMLLLCMITSYVCHSQVCNHNLSWVNFEFYKDCAFGLVSVFFTLFPFLGKFVLSAWLGIRCTCTNRQGYIEMNDVFSSAEYCITKQQPTFLLVFWSQRGSGEIGLWENAFPFIET